MNEPATVIDDPYKNIPVADLYRLLRVEEERATEAAACKKGIIDELYRRYQAPLNEAYSRKGVPEGSVTLDIGDGLRLKADRKKAVKWDTAKLMDAMKTLPWDQAQQVFKITVAVPEKNYSSMASLNPDLYQAVTAARTTEVRPATIKIEEVE